MKNSLRTVTLAAVCLVGACSEEALQVRPAAPIQEPVDLLCNSVDVNAFVVRTDTRFTVLKKSMNAFEGIGTPLYARFPDVWPPSNLKDNFTDALAWLNISARDPHLRCTSPEFKKALGDLLKSANTYPGLFRMPARQINDMPASYFVLPAH